MPWKAGVKFNGLFLFDWGFIILAIKDYNEPSQLI